MTLVASRKANEIFKTCKPNTLPPKETQLIALAAQLVAGDTDRARDTLERAIGSGASREEILCTACAAACTVGKVAQDAYTSLLDRTPKNPFYRVEEQALDKKTTHLVQLAACLAAGCRCAAGHIVEARAAKASEAELARVACITSCVAGRVQHWRFIEALQCAEGKKACAC